MSIAVHGLSRHFRRGTESVTALDSVDLELFPGELVVAAGPSGSGKTTLLSILAGIDEPDTGTVRLLPPLPADTPVADLPWSDLAFVPQSPTLLDELTVAENIDLPARLAAGRNGRPRRAHRTRDDARSNESGRGGASGGYRRRSGADGETLLDLGERGPRPDGRALLPGEFGAGASVSGTAALDDRFDGAGQAGGYTTAQLLADLEIGQLADRYPSQTSGGEQQRTAIGRALRLRPRILLADEPTGHQDRARVGLVLDILRRHAYAGYTVLISSHNADMIHVADRVVTLADGRIVTDSYHRVGRP